MALIWVVSFWLMALITWRIWRNDRISDSSKIDGHKEEE